MADDIDKLIKWVKSQGWRVESDASGYRHFYTPDGTWVARYPKTPSRSRRRYMEVLGALKKNGLVWPIPSKSEQRSERRKEGQA